MNIEMFFIFTEDREKVIALIEQRLKSPPDSQGMQPDWGLQSSYDAILACEKKRKIAISPSINGSIAAIESKEVLDFILLQLISEVLKTEIIAIQYSDSIGAYGYAYSEGGVVMKSYYSETDDAPLASIRQYLLNHGVPYDLMTFREAIQNKKNGWIILESSRFQGESI